MKAPDSVGDGFEPLAVQQVLTLASGRERTELLIVDQAELLFGQTSDRSFVMFHVHTVPTATDIQPLTPLHFGSGREIARWGVQSPCQNARVGAGGKLPDL